MNSDSPRPLSESIPNSILRQLQAPGANRRARRAYRHTRKVFALYARKRLKAEEKPALLGALGRYAKARDQATGKRTLSLFTVEIYRVLLFVCGQNNAGWTVKSQQRIAKIAGCARSTVAKHLRLLQDHGFLYWVNTLVRVRTPAQDDLGGPGATRLRVFNGQNAYALEKPELSPQPSKAETRTPQRRQGANLLREIPENRKDPVLAQALAAFEERFMRANARAGPK